MEYHIGDLFSSDGTDISISSPTESGVQQTIYQYDHTCWSQNIVEGRKDKIHKLNLKKKNKKKTLKRTDNSEAMNCYMYTFNCKGDNLKDTGC